MTLYGEWTGFIIHMSRNNKQLSIRGCRHPADFMAHRKAEKSSVQRMVPVKEADHHCNHYMRRDRKLTKLTTVASSGEEKDKESFHQKYLTSFI